MQPSRLFAVAAVLLMVAAPAAAAPGAVEIGFNPPIGVSLLYDCNAVRTVEGRPLTIVSQHELRFAGKAPAARSLRWTVKSLAVSGGEPVRRMLQAVGDIAVGVPVEIALTSEGAVAAIANEAAIRAHVRAAAPGVTAAFAPVFAPAPEATRAALDAMLADELGALDPPAPEAFAATWLELIEPLVGGEAPLVPGAVTEADVEAQAPIGGGALRYRLRYGLRDYVPGKSATIFHALAADPDDVQRWAATLVAQMFPAAAAPGQNEATATLAILSQMTSSTDITSEISLPTGLRTRFSTATTTSLPGRPQRVESRECRLETSKTATARPFSELQ